MLTSMEPAEVESLLEIEDWSAEAWCGVFLRQKINTDRIRPRETAEIVCHALLRKVEGIGCTDKYTVWKIIRIMYFWLDALHFEIDDDFDLEAFKRGDAIETHSAFTKRICSTISSLLQLSLLKSDVKIIMLLLNYGYVPPIDVYDEELGYIEMYTIWFELRDAPKLPGHVCTDECREKFWDRVEVLDPDMFANVRGCENLRVYQRGHKRILMAALCIWVLNNQVTNRTNNAEHAVQCLRLYFRAVADPFVQADEYEELLRFLLFDTSKDYVDGLVQDFKRLYPESQGPYRPRSLKHLSRCAIRQKLSKRSEVLRVLLDDLGFPNYLKMYIMGDL